MIAFCIKFICAFLLYIGLQQLIELKTHGFCLQRIQADDLPHYNRWESKAPTSEEQSAIDRHLTQPFYLIGAGAECFAFVSEDGQTVIKFFKLDHVRPVYFQKGLLTEDYSAFAGTLSDHPLTKLILPSPFHHWLKRFLGIREFRLNRTFSSIKLAYDSLKKETGILYLHLNPTDHFHHSLTLYDASGIAHQIDLDSSKFFLQKKAVAVEPHLAALKARGAHEESKACIDSLIALLVGRCKKGFSDRDILDRNLGFIGTEAIEIDSGSFTRSPRMAQPWLYKQELYYGTLELKAWLKKHYPEMVSYLEDRVSEQVFENI